MGTISLFGKDVIVRDKDCKLDNLEEYIFESPRITLFIQLTNECNARCNFCEYHGESSCAFDFEKLTEIVQELSNRVWVNKVNITGGEPLINMPNFERLMQILIDNKATRNNIVVNTNGIRLSRLLEYQDNINSISLSRHHYKDKLNEKVFGCGGLPKLRDIKDFQSKCKNDFTLHSRCNLINGYIDSREKIKEYLRVMASVDVIWNGFVTLMPLNKYCVDNVVCSSSLIESGNEFYQNQLWRRYENNKIECQCADYIYCTPSGRLSFFYNRIFCNPNLNAGQLVFDGRHLRQGFNGEIII